MTVLDSTEEPEVNAGLLNPVFNNDLNNGTQPGHKKKRSKRKEQERLAKLVMRMEHPSSPHEHLGEFSKENEPNPDPSSRIRTAASIEDYNNYHLSLLEERMKRKEERWKKVMMDSHKGKHTPKIASIQLINDKNLGKENQLPRKCRSDGAETRKNDHLLKHLIVFSDFVEIELD